MPQIFLMLSPQAQSKLGNTPDRAWGMLERLDRALSHLVITEWDVPKEDVACSAANLLYARGEADIQIEFRYTAGDDEYGTGKAFEPTKEQRGKLVDAALKAAKELFQKYDYNLTCSAWPKPYKDSEFKMGT